MKRQPTGWGMGWVGDLQIILYDGVNYQNIQITHKTQEQKKAKYVIWAEGLTDIFPKKTYRWLTGT